MIYFTSDLHFDHQSIIPFFHRPFNNFLDMNYQLINNINNIVGENDELYILGDFCVCDETSLLEKSFEFAKMIKCKHKHLLIGNHDADIEQLSNYNNQNLIFDTISLYKEIEYNNTKVILCHYPFADYGWSHAEYGSIHLHGHLHSKSDYNKKNRNNNVFKYDVGVDANNYLPISIDKVFDFFNIKASN